MVDTTNLVISKSNEVFLKIKTELYRAIAHHKFNLDKEE